MELLTEATKAWQRTRHPRWAALAQVAVKDVAPREVLGGGKKKEDAAAWDALLKQGDPLDLTRLVAALRGMTAAEAASRVKVLGKRDDPRFFTELLSILEAPPWRANVFKDFVNATLEVLEASKDVRVREAWLELAPRYKAIIETSVGDWVGTKLLASAKKLEGVEPKALTEADEKRLATLELANGVATVAKKKKSASDAELLAMVYAAPNDDQPRLVFADALTERGDERGEFISLQLTRAQGRGTPELLARERALFRDPKRNTAWALPLSNGGTFRFDRGFPAVIKLKAAGAKKVVGDPAWATVRRVENLEEVSAKGALALLEHAAMACVTEVSSLTENMLEGLSVKPRAWTRVCVAAMPSREQLASWTALHALELQAWDATFDGRALASAPTLRALELGVTNYAPEAFVAVPHLESLRLGLPREGVVSPELLKPLTRLRSLHLHVNGELLLPTLSHLELDSLSLHAGWQVKEPALRALLQQCPHLTRLEVRGGPAWLTPAFALELLQTTALKEVRFAPHNHTFAVVGDVLELVGISRATVEDFAPLVRSGRVKSVRVAERIFEGDPLTFSGQRPEDVALVAALAALL